MNILVADDHALVRRGLIEFLKGAEPSWMFQEAGNFGEVESVLHNGGIDLMIIDLNMPGMQRIASLRALRSQIPNTRMIVLTADDDRTTILECLGAGVHGYLAKSGDTANILDALRVVVAGGVYVPPTLSQVPGPNQSAPEHGAHGGHHSHGGGYGHGVQHGSALQPQSSFASASSGGVALQEGLRLSGRQHQVLQLLAEGRSTKDIARVLDLGIGTVKVHLAAIYRTLGARNRMEAIVKAGVVSRV